MSSSPRSPAVARLLRSRSRGGPRRAGTRRGCRRTPSSAPTANAAIAIDSTTANGSPSIRTRFLERAGLRLVGVADEVVRLGRPAARPPPTSGRSGTPRRRGRRARTAPTSSMTCCGPIRAGPLERPEAAVGAVVVERGRVDDADARQEPEAGLAGLRDARRDRRGLVLLAADAVARIRRDRAAQPAGDARRVDRAGDERPRLGARDREHRRRRPLAEPEARRPEPGRAGRRRRRAGRPERPLEVGRRRPPRPASAARDVVADVGDDRRPRRRREQRVERGDAVGLGRRHRQAAADVVQRRLADPADPRLDRVEGRDQQVAPRRGPRGRRGRRGPRPSGCGRRRASRLGRSRGPRPPPPAPRARRAAR